MRLWLKEGCIADDLNDDGDQIFFTEGSIPTTLKYVAFL
jgi:hypothetical protein